MLKSKNNILLALFLLTVIAAVYYPISKIICYEYAPYEICRFQIRLFDPYDAFRGHYVALSPVRQTVRVPDENDFKHRGAIYAVLERGEDGFASVIGLSNKIAHGEVNLLLDETDLVRTNTDEADGDEYMIDFPFRRYYMNEYLAPEAEDVFLSALKSNSRCAVVVKIYKDGNFATDDLEINGVPIREFIRIEQEAQSENARTGAEEDRLK